jgi:hypothetical protein
MLGLMMLRPAKSPQDQQCIQHSDKSARRRVTDNDSRFPNRGGCPVTQACESLPKHFRDEELK